MGQVGASASAAASAGSAPATGRRSIVFVGFMGAGKSTAAALVADALGEPGLDTDQLLERELGETIESFFDREGEEAFARAKRSSSCARSLGPAAA